MTDNRFNPERDVPDPGEPQSRDEFAPIGLASLAAFAGMLSALKNAFIGLPKVVSEAPLTLDDENMSDEQVPGDSEDTGEHHFAFSGFAPSLIPARIWDSHHSISRTSTPYLLR